MDKEAIQAYYGSHIAELEDVYLKNDHGYQEREKELKEAVSQMEALIKELGHEIWLRFDRVLSAHNRCEAYALQAMYVKGVLDAGRFFCPLRKEEGNGGN